MIIVLRSGSTDAELNDVCSRIRGMGYTPHTIRGEVRTVIGAVGDDRGKERLQSLESLECVELVQPILQPFKLASREVRSEATQVRVGDVTIGGEALTVMAGPCSVESREQLLEVAAQVKAAGATILRGGAFKPRTSPYAFQGLEEEGLKLLDEARRATGLPDGAEPPEGAAATAAGSPRRAMARTAAASARLSAPANRIVPGIPSQPISRNAAARAPAAAPIELVK